MFGNPTDAIAGVPAKIIPVVAKNFLRDKFFFMSHEYELELVTLKY
ncbi:MAG: hypothetical protein BalsKO_07520 [Balneolaceae bacterium]